MLQKHGSCIAFQIERHKIDRQIKTKYEKALLYCCLKLVKSQRMEDDFLKAKEKSQFNYH